MADTTDLGAALQVFIDRGLVTRDQARRGLGRIAGAAAAEARREDRDSARRAAGKLRGKLAETSASLTPLRKKGGGKK
jgi:hypothetical protein